MKFLPDHLVNSMTFIVFIAIASFMGCSKRQSQAPNANPAGAMEVTRQGFEGTDAGDRKELAPAIFFRWCPSGTFTMGSPKSERAWADSTPSKGAWLKNEDQVTVTFNAGFWLCETEVTQGQWRRLMGNTPWRGKEHVKEGDDYAANYISYNDAVAYCEKMTTQETKSGRLPKGWKYSLPTEAQWEYGCRAGTKTKYSCGEDDLQLKDFGWIKNDIQDDRDKYAHRAGTKMANGWGLKDMHGNVCEWCSDWYADRLSGGTDPLGPTNGSNRVMRGGGWFNNAIGCRSAHRGIDGEPPDDRDATFGFRVAVVPCSN